MHFYETLFQAKNHRKCGNHSVKVNYNELGKKQELIFYHYKTPICFVYPRQKLFILTDRGYNTSSTHKAIGNYYRYFTSMNYKLVGLCIYGTYANRFKFN